MFRSGSLGGADHQSSKNEKETRKKVNVLIIRQHKHYSNSDILCLMAKYSLGLLIFKQFSKVFFFIFQLLLSFITEMMAINKSTGKTKCS